MSGPFGAHGDGFDCTENPPADIPVDLRLDYDTGNMDPDDPGYFLHEYSGWSVSHHI
ncbi:hypothetical protein IWQ60_007263 [Tieghemiomyces parasiticus]|uniref:Uncharacterized protein n=1 Tax=Tieghemiomyces parasiticus TaxID=78921 RepID=A0A9W7ZYV7_9FUNG|nr:hypothetical protein IWQ60_007263 [Tieghemiomyces parasiticus]